MDFDRTRKVQSGIIFASEMMKDDLMDNDPTKVVNGIRFTKELIVQPHRGDMFGLLAGSGVGKTTTMAIIAGDVVEYNPDQYVVIFSLEMTKREIFNKLCISFGNDKPHLLKQIIIIDCYNADGSNKELRVADIKLELKRIKQTLNAIIAMTMIDHFHEIHNNGSVDYNPIAKDLKNLAVECDTLVFIPSQTTKEKGLGDIPVAKNGCFGCSRYENLCSFILTIFQPLRRVQNECDLPALGWQFSKIRNKRGKRDRTKEEINYVLKYDGENETLLPLTPNETHTFSMYYEKVLELRENEEKKKSYAFDLSTTIRGKDGKEVRLTKIVGGREEDS